MNIINYMKLNSVKQRGNLIEPIEATFKVTLMSFEVGLPRLLLQLFSESMFCSDTISKV